MWYDGKKDQDVKMEDDDKRIIEEPNRYTPAIKYKEKKKTYLWLQITCEGDQLDFDKKFFTKNSLEVDYSDRAPWMKIALQEYETYKGLKEWDSVLSKKIKDYHNTTKYNKGDGHETAWCSSFVNFVIEKAGYKGMSSSRSLDWLNWGKVISNPIYGAIAVKTRFGGGHVGFVFTKKGKKGVVILGGNQKDELKKSIYINNNIFTYIIPSNYNPTKEDQLIESNKEYDENFKED